MPLNKLDNFIKNIEGRILYVNPSDLDSTDSVTNEGNSLAQPFKTVQRALLEAARFSYLQGINNDITEKTTILLFPGEHIIDNRPGYGIYSDQDQNAKVRTPAGQDYSAAAELQLALDSNFDLTQSNNILYKFNSIHGGVVVPRGTSIVGLDLRKTKIRPKYVPNPTDNTPPTSIFKITGACYFWQFSIFDGDESGEVYTNDKDYGQINRAKPQFSHNKLTCFEYCDGVNDANPELFVDREGNSLTDLDMYYHKVGNAYNTFRSIEDDFQFPRSSEDFAKRDPEWEIVGAFQPDPILIQSITSGIGGSLTPSTQVTVTTTIPHNLNSGTPIKIRGINAPEYNISTKVDRIINETTFLYSLPSVALNTPVNPTKSTDAAVTVETDTVGGASPYVFNISLRSVWGMQGMHADGSKASGFRSMVVAQFTAVSLQKDDRAFVKYDPVSQRYSGLTLTPQYGSELIKGASSTSDPVYHFDQDAIYRPGWESSHIKVSNDSFIQIVSVFAIGFTYHFDIDSGADASITNSNSNFGQVALKSSGYKKEAFLKDDHGYVTSIIAPKHINDLREDSIEWLSFDVKRTRSAIGAGRLNRLYLAEYFSKDSAPIAITQGYRIGARKNDSLYLRRPGISGVEYSSPIYMDGPNNQLHTSQKEYTVTIKSKGSSFGNHFRLTDVENSSSSHNLQTGEKVIITSETGNIPENLDAHAIYYVITYETDPYSAETNPGGLESNAFIKLASTFTNAQLGEGIVNYGGSGLKIISRVSDKDAGDVGSPIQYDEITSPNQWYINVDTDSDIIKSMKNSESGNEFAPNNNVPYDGVNVVDAIGIGYVPADNQNLLDAYNEESDISFVKRVPDERSLDEKTYKLRVVIPKESVNAKNPETGFVIQESTSQTTDNDFIPGHDDSITSFTVSNSKDYDRNNRFLADIERSATTYLQTGLYRITVRTEQPHGLKLGNIVNIKNVKDSGSGSVSKGRLGEFNYGFNGTFEVTEVVTDLEFRYLSKDIRGVNHAIGDAIATDFNTRTKEELPRFEKKDNNSNLYIYRTEILQEYDYLVSDGIYHLYVLNSSNYPNHTYTDYKFTQLPVDLYPQMDRDNYNDNPLAAKSFARGTPIGDVITNDLRNSITRETIDIFNKDFDNVLPIQTIGGSTDERQFTFKVAHGLNGAIGKYTTISNNTHASLSLVTKTHYNVKLYVDSSTTSPTYSNWYGTTAKVVVTNGTIVEIEIIASGSGYTSSTNTYLHIKSDEIGSTDSTTYTYIGGSSNPIGIEDYTGCGIQVTGNGVNEDTYHFIKQIDNHTSFTINTVRSSGGTFDGFKNDQVVFITGRAITIDSNTATDATTKETTITTSEPHGLVAGNKFRIIKKTSPNQYWTVVADEIVSNTSESAETVIKFVSNTSYTANELQNVNGYIIKHGMSSNDKISDVRDENIASRNAIFYKGETFKLSTPYNIDNSGSIQLTCLSGLGGNTFLGYRLKLGDYLFVDGEIMRVSGEISLTTDATPNLIVPVIRALLGTKPKSHVTETVAKKIKLCPVQFRRPSICRASGHTFEYLGYGPGNYSTALPQIQIKTLSEREDFLVQAQERSGGLVVYTGMNNKGDTFTGNTKVSAASGETISYDIPKSTVTGQDPSKLSVSFDEVTVKERIVVEGGDSGFVLSQFNGPVTLTKSLRVKDKSIFTRQVRVQDPTESSNVSTGAVIVRGGIAIGEGSVFGKQVDVLGNLNLPDKSRILLGDDDDLQIYHADDKSVIQNIGSSKLYLDSAEDFSIVDNSTRTLNDSTLVTYTPSSYRAKFKKDAGVELYYDGEAKFETTDTGVNITGITTSSNGVNIPEDKSLIFSGQRNGTVVGHEVSASDGENNTNDHSIARISRDATNHLLIENYRSNNDGEEPGNIYLRNVDYPNNADNVNNDRYIHLEARHGQKSIECRSNGPVTLYHGKNSVDEVDADGDKKLETTTVGVTVTGTVTASLGFIPDENAGAYLGQPTNVFSAAYIDDLSIDGQKISSSSNNKDIQLGPHGNGKVDIQSKVQAESLAINNSGDKLTIDTNGNLSSSGSIFASGIVTFTGNANFRASDPTTITETHFKKSTWYNAADGAGVTIDQTSIVAEKITIGEYNTGSHNTDKIYAHGNIKATGDVYAFVSDIRLKENIEQIPNALDKVLSLTGFTYNLNDVAASLGYDTEQTHVGVSAQDVQKVLPQVVVESAASEDYMTVQYDKLVPLLIESIKELNAKVEDLERKLSDK